MLKDYTIKNITKIREEYSSAGDFVFKSAYGILMDFGMGHVVSMETHTAMSECAKKLTVFTAQDLACYFAEYVYAKDYPYLITFKFPDNDIICLQVNKQITSMLYDDINTEWESFMSSHMDSDCIIDATTELEKSLKENNIKFKYAAISASF